MRHHKCNSVGFFGSTWQASRLSTITLLLSSLFLVACGGGSDDYSSTDNAVDGAPSLSAVSIASGDKSTVTVGDVVTVTISSSEAISAPTVTIGGSTATTVSGSDDAWTASRAMTAEDTAGAISVDVAYSDIGGDAGVSATATTDSSAIMFEIILQSGFAIDGPFQNAKAFGDYNGNGLHDADEPSDLTDENGAYSLVDTAFAPAVYTIVVEMTADTVDAISGESYADTGVVLKGSSAGTVVTPLTTILEAAKVSNPEFTAADLALAMGLPVGVDIATYNPFAADADAATAHAVETVFQQVMTATLLVAEAIQGVGAIAGVELSAAQASAAALTALTNMVVASAGEVDLADSAQVAALQAFAKTELVAQNIVVSDAVADFILDKASATVTTVAAAFDSLTADDFTAGNTAAVSLVKQEAAAELAAMTAAAVTYLTDNTDVADLSAFDTSATLTLDTTAGVDAAIVENGNDAGSGTDVIAFDEADLVYAFADIGPDSAAGEGQNSAIVVDPADSNNLVVKSTRKGNTTTYNGLWFTGTEQPSGEAGEFQFQADNSIVSMRVRSAAAGKTVLLKFEVGTSAVTTTATTTKVDEWETLEFDFANPIEGTSINLSSAYNKVVVIYDFLGSVDQADQIFYFDDITYTSTDGGTDDGTDGETSAVATWGAFEGAYNEDDVFTFPAAAQSYAGFSNDNATLYPFSFPNGGTLTFTGAIPAGGADVAVHFTFEANPYPDVNPFFVTETVTVTGEAEATYSVAIPAQGDKTFNSFLMYLETRDAGVIVKDVTVTAADESTDTGGTDTGGTDTDTTAITWGLFDGTTIDGDTYAFPAGAQAWAGFSNDNTTLYPFSFPNGGTLTFTGAIPAGGADVAVHFTFEANVYPNVDPSFMTESVTVTGEAETTYTLAIPAQGDKTFNSFLMYLETRDASVIVKNVTVTAAEGTGTDTGGTDTSGSTDVVAAGELITNGTFENADLAGWVVDGAGTATAVNTAASEGSFSAQLSAGSAQDAMIKAANLAAGEIAVGQTVTVSFDLKGDLTGVGGVVFAQFFYETASAGVSNGAGGLGGGLAPLAVTSEWKTFSYTQTIDSNVDGGVSLLLKASCGAEICGVDAYFDNISIVVGATEAEDAASAVATWGLFDGTTIDGDSYAFPTGAQDWAGFSNDNADLYPFSFPNGGTLTFTGAIPAGGADVAVHFTFEANPYPNVTPFFVTDTVTVTGEAEATYSVAIPAQDDKTFNSFLMYLETRDATVIVKNVTVTATAVVAEGELITNGTFENADIVGWDVFGVGTATAVNTEAKTGSFSMQLSAGSAQDAVAKAANLSAGVVEIGQTATVSFDLKGSLTGVGGVVFAQFFYETATEGTSNGAGALGGGLAPLSVTDSWQSFSYTQTIDSDVSGGLTLQLKAGCGADTCSVDAYFDNVSVVVQ